MEPPAIGPKMKKMEQKVSLKLWKMSSGFMIMLNIHGIKECSMEDKPDEAKVKEREKEKEQAEEVEDTSSQEDPKAVEKVEEKAALTWWEKKGMKKTGKKKKKTGMIPGTKAIGPMTKTGMMAIGPQKNCTTRMSMVISRRKAKGRKARKERKARMMKVKEASQEMEKASPTMLNLKPHQLQHTPAIQNQQPQQAHYSTAASSSGQCFVSFAETDPARVDVLSANYEEQEYHRRTRQGGQNQRDAVAQRNRESMKRFPVVCRRS